ncbi:MAG: HD domain-containing protein [Planctomycetota bacterium]|nr:HD domain-containing protein [Planctomycetaceae bacterium]MDQ3330573.1 HD domain-containing protein [Planctomycetota bacterium]
MPRKYLNEYKDGDAVDEVFLLAEKTLRANRNANLYLLAVLRDKTGTMVGMQWNVTEEGTANVNACDFVHVKGKVQLYQGGLQMIVTGIKPVPKEGIDPAEFHPQPSGETPRRLERMRELLGTMTNPHLAALVESFWADDAFMQAFAQAPAGVKAHHAYLGGLVEHVLNILETANRIADLYPSLDRDVLLTGVFLHDLGKVREMGYDTSFTYTDEGQLLGHLLIGCEMLAEKVPEIERRTGEGFPPPLLWHLKHIILSHHGTVEYGAAKLPMTPEAVAIHHLDALDAKVHEFAKSIEEDPNGESNWTPFSPRLQRKLFKVPKLAN